jgi:hypothetical protein
MKPYWLLSMAVLCACPAVLPAQPKLEPVPIALPKPGYEGTPFNFLNIPNMERPSSKERGRFLAPAGVTNVAKGKKVTSSEKDPVVGDLEAEVLLEWDLHQALIHGEFISVLAIEVFPGCGGWPVTMSIPGDRERDAFAVVQAQRTALMIFGLSQIENCCNRYPGLEFWLIEDSFKDVERTRSVVRLPKGHQSYEH